MRKSLPFGWLGVMFALLSACSEPASAPRASGASADPPAAEASPSSPARAARGQVIFLGDSLTAGLGLDPSDSFPSLIQRRLDEAGLPFEVVNAGVSGDTSAGGVRRLEWSLQGLPKVLVVALGANDGLRGLPADELRKNLSTIIERAQRDGVKVVLAGMEAPPNNGPDYTAGFRAVYVDLAATYRVPLIPFLLLGVAGEAGLNQADGIHPNQAGAERVAATVWQTLAPVVAQAASGSR